MFKNGIIWQWFFDYVAPVALSRKKDGSHRLCIDYRKHNWKIIKDRYIFQVIEEVFDKLEEARIFTTLDLKNRLFHVEIEKSSNKYTSFKTPEEKYEFLGMSFGLCMFGNQF